MKNLYNSKLKKVNLLEKLVLLLLVQNAITCHAITVTNYHFTWCSAMINVMFNTVKPLSIVSERTVKIDDERGITTDAGVTYFKLFGENCMEIIIAGQIFI
jgi:hypothetical protein